MNLEEAIRIHLENERKETGPEYNAAVIRAARLHIRVFETAPRNSRSLQLLVENNKRELERALSIEKTEDLYAESRTISACPSLGRKVGLPRLLM